MSGRLEGKLAIVTGGARGIGEAVVRRFVAEGAQVIVADLREDLGEALVQELGDTVNFVVADVTSEAAWQRLIAAADARGGLDILVNNAGGAMGLRDMADEDLAQHKAVVDLNLHGTWLGMRHAIAAMKPRGGGSIVNISSIDGLVGMKSLASYSAAKFGVVGLTKSVALEVGRDNIRINAVHPGFIATPLMLSAPPERLAEYTAAVEPQPIARHGRPDEIAGAVVYFASDDASYCTGSSLVVAGGRLAG
jgi:3alpha(or 20beta)-hydroxysteroid dehydrogenase